MDKLGFIGLGVMGEPMCRNLARRQRGKVHAHDLRPEPLRRLGVDRVASAPSIPELDPKTPKSINPVMTANRVVPERLNVRVAEVAARSTVTDVPRVHERPTTDRQQAARRQVFEWNAAANGSI